MRQDDIWRLLRRNISRSQLIGYIIANVIGLSVVLTGVQFFIDSNHSTSGDDAYFSRDYVVVSKKVAGIGFTPSNFSEEEIEEIRNQSWVKKVGEFTSSQFSVRGGVSMGGRGLYSYMFFESVPDEFFDVKPRDWEFNPEENFIPIIISKDYLALYNYGFAAPQGLPQVSEEIIGAIPINMTLTGTGNAPMHFDAAIVGFSSRLNTIAVPDAFMQWANSKFAPDSEQSSPSRLILQIDRMGSDAMAQFFDERGIEVSGDDEGAGNIAGFLSVVSGVVAAGGIVICALAVFILILSIFLMLQKSRTMLRHIMLLGYAPRELSKYYRAIVLICNIAIAIVSVIIALLIRTMWASRLRDIGIGDGTIVWMLLTAVSYLAIVLAIDFRVIGVHMRRIWRG